MLQGPGAKPVAACRDGDRATALEELASAPPVLCPQARLIATEARRPAAATVATARAEGQQAHALALRLLTLATPAGEVAFAQQAAAIYRQAPGLGSTAAARDRRRWHDRAGQSTAALPELSAPATTEARRRTG